MLRPTEYTTRSLRQTVEPQAVVLRVTGSSTAATLVQLDLWSIFIFAELLCSDFESQMARAWCLTCTAICLRETVIRPVG